MRALVRVRAWLARCGAERHRTMFGVARVYEIAWMGERIRVLDVEGTYQSATYLGRRWCDPPFDYLARYDCMFDAGVVVRDMCMLGGGGYAYPKHVIAHHRGSRIDVVEIDPAITRIAREWFFLDRLCQTYRVAETGRLGLVCDDALSYLRKCAERGRRYDAILNDCFAAGSPEESMDSRAAASLVHRCLNDGGLYLANCITALEGTRAAPLERMARVLGSEFSHVLVVPSADADDGMEDNVLVVATDADVRIPGAVRLVDAW